MVIFINQIRMKIGVMFGKPGDHDGRQRAEVLRLGASRHPPHRRDQGSRRGRRQPDPRQGGEEQARAAVPQVEFDIMYGEGISKVGELVDLGVKAGIVEKSGAWFSYDSQRIGQGRENAKPVPARTNPNVAKTIEAAIRQNAGLIADKHAVGNRRARGRGRREEPDGPSGRDGREKPGSGDHSSSSRDSGPCDRRLSWGGRRVPGRDPA
jgi:recombination protein RecA